MPKRRNIPLTPELSTVVEGGFAPLGREVASDEVVDFLFKVAEDYDTYRRRGGTGREDRDMATSYDLAYLGKKIFAATILLDDQGVARREDDQPWIEFLEQRYDEKLALASRQDPQVEALGAAPDPSSIGRPVLRVITGGNQ